MIDAHDESHREGKVQSQAANISRIAMHNSSPSFRRGYPKRNSCRCYFIKHFGASMAQFGRKHFGSRTGMEHVRCNMTNRDKFGSLESRR